MSLHDIKERIERVKEEIETACRNSGRNTSDVKLVAVTKTVGIDVIRQAIDAGLDTFGENYVKEAIEKAQVLPPHLHWHFIGNIQKNKVKHMVSHFELIHSIGTKEIISEIDGRAMQAGIIQPVLFEINLAREATKSGFTKDDFYEAIPFIKSLKHIIPSGLMTIPPPVNDEPRLSGYFSALREMRDKFSADNWLGSTFKELSMGMSSDFKIAIKEGATMIRIGTMIFGPRG